MVASLSKPQGILDSLKISVTKLEALVAGHPIVANLSVKTPVSNPFLTGDVVGEIDFATLRQTIPIDSMEIGGMAHANIHFNGPWSAIDKGEYDNFQTKGAVTLNDFFYSSPAFPERVGIQSGTFAFNSKEVTIASMKGKFGQSDFTVDGSFANYWAYLLKDGTILGNIKLKSDLLDVTQLMNGGTQNKDTTHLGDPYVIPARIDLTVLAAVDRMLYSRMEIRGTTGKLVVKDQKLNLDQLSMNLLKGTMVLSGVYAAKEKSPADFNFKIDIKDFDLPTCPINQWVLSDIFAHSRKQQGYFPVGIVAERKIGEGLCALFRDA